MQGSNETLRTSVVLQDLARGLHAARDRGVRDGAAVPDFFDDFFFGNDAVAVLDQQCEQREDLGLEAAELAVRPQLERREVKPEGAELVNHGRA